MAVMASCAFFSLAAETIFIALVIFIVEPMEVILFLISFKFAILFSYELGIRSVLTIRTKI